MWDKYVLFIDGEAIVIDKPAGLAVHPGSRTPESLEDYLKHFRFGFKRAPLPVHRLDRDTSGCLLLARNPKAHKRFQRAFEAKKVTKTYLAVVDGVPEAAEGEIDMPLAKISSEAEGWRMVADPGGRPSLTRWRRLAVRDGRAVILFSPETGRTHQIRVHSADGLGIPISGDPVYGGSNGPMLLHALSIRVDRDGKPPVEATAPLPDLRQRRTRRRARGRALARGDAARLRGPSRGGARPRTRTMAATTEPFAIPEEALEEKFLASTGPGGQNVNKVATACQLRCDVFRLGLAPAVYARLRTLAGSRMTTEGEIVITARTYRTQEANREEARARLADLIAKAHIAPRRRVKTRPSRAAKARRVDEKKGRGAVKAGRGKVKLD